MTTFRITWDIEIDAETVLEAVELAKEIQQDPDSTANVFRTKDLNNGEEEIIDLDIIGNLTNI